MLYTIAVVALACGAPRAVNCLPPFGDVIPLRVTAKGHLLVPAHANRTLVWLLLDTGATGTCLTTQAAERLKLKPAGEGGAVHVGDGGRLASRYYSLPQLALGRCADHRLLIEAADLKLVARCAADLGITVDGVLGAELLKRFNGVIDYGRRTLSLSPVWAGDLTAMQGEWVATGLEDDGQPLWPKRGDLRGVRLVVHGDRMTLDLKAIGMPRLEQRLDLHPEYAPKRWASRQPAFDGVPVAGEDAGTIGQYEVAGDRLRFLLSTKYISEHQLPDSMTAKVPNSGFMLFTFRRAAGGTGLVSGLARRLGVSQHLARWTGWEWAVTPDWTLTGVHAGRRLRLTARLDGSVTVQPVRP
jgi:uncharacterized protein (TIGR03067 family)